MVEIMIIIMVIIILARRVLINKKKRTYLIDLAIFVDYRVKMKESADVDNTCILPKSWKNYKTWK